MSANAYAIMWLVFLFICVSSVSADNPVHDLLYWVREKGGVVSSAYCQIDTTLVIVDDQTPQVNVRVGASEMGVRGLVASQAFRSGDVLVSLPISLAIPLGASEETAPVG